MRKLLVSVLLCVFAATAPLRAKSKDYIQATLTRVDIFERMSNVYLNGVSTPMVGRAALIEVSTDQTRYIVDWSWGFFAGVKSYGAPEELNLGQQIGVRIKGKTMFLQSPEGGEMKASIHSQSELADPGDYDQKVDEFDHVDQYTVYSKASGVMLHSNTQVSQGWARRGGSLSRDVSHEGSAMRCN
jgi:hypothetical protein